jgi:hypothetical protein
MANQVDIGNNTILIIKIPARGATDWAAEFKTNFADEIAEHDHTTGKGARIKNAALVTNTMVADGDGVTKVDGTFTAYTSADVAVSTDTIQDLAVTRAKIANDAVDGTKIADNSITADHIVDGTIIAADVANDAITTAKILDANVTTAKIADGAVTLDKLSNTIFITQDTTITGNVENTHYIIDSSTAVTLTFNGSAQVVDSCKFSANVSPAIHKIELHGDITFQNNDMDGYASLYIDLQNIDLDAFIIKNNNIKTVRVQADFEGLDTGLSGDTGAANFLHNIMTIRSQGTSDPWRMPLGSFNWNKITFIGSAAFYTYVTDNVSDIKHSLTASNQTNVIEFLDGYDLATSTYGTVDNPTTNSTLTISDTKPFAVYGNEKKGVLTPELSDLSDVSSTAPTAGDRLEWDGTEWAPVNTTFGEFSATFPGSTSGFVETLSLSSSQSQGGISIGSGNQITLTRGAYLVTLSNIEFQGQGMGDQYSITGISSALTFSSHGVDRSYAHIINITASTGTLTVQYDDDGNGGANPSLDMVIVRV